MTQDSHSILQQFLAHHQYDEALSVIETLLAEDPSDREIRMLHLLIVRILVLRWNLSRSFPMSLDATPEEIIRSDDAMYLPGRTAPATRGMKVVTGAATALLCVLTLLAFPMQEPRNETAGRESRATTISMDDPDGAALRTAVHKLEWNTKNPKDAVIPNEQDRSISRSAVGEEGVVLPGVEAAESAPAGQGSGSVIEDKKAAPSGAAAASLRRGQTDDRAKLLPDATKLKPESSKTPSSAAVKSGSKPRRYLGSFQSAYAVAIRKEPRFAAPVVQKIDRGKPLEVLESAGSWVRVEVRPGGATGFVRREFLVPVEDDESNVVLARLR